VRYRTTGTALAAVCLAATACGGSEDDYADPIAASECSDQPEVVVTDTGAEPRRPMRLTPTVGDTTAVDVQMAMTTEGEMNGRAVSAPESPPIELGMRMTVEDVRADEVEISFVYDRVQADAEPAVAERVRSFQNSSGTLVTTRQGVFVDGDLQLAPGTDPAVRSVMDQLERQMADLTIPLPGEPVGAGAEWEVTSSVELYGVKLCNVATYRLTEFDGTTYVMETATKIRPVEGGVYEVRGSGHAEGTSTGDLSSPIARSAEVRGNTEMSVSAQTGGDEVTQEVRTSMIVELEERA